MAKAMTDTPDQMFGRCPGGIGVGGGTGTSSRRILSIPLPFGA